MTNKHTPAPWKVGAEEKSECRCIEIEIGQEGSPYLLAIVREFEEKAEEGRANANLIAAAPELLDTLTDTFDAINRGVDIGQDATELYDQIQAAINRAEGL